MGYLDAPDAGMTSIHVREGATLMLVVEDAAHLKRHHAPLYDAIVECAAFVNLRCAQEDLPPLLALAFQT